MLRRPLADQGTTKPVSEEGGADAVYRLGLAPRKSGESPPSLWQCGSRGTLPLRDLLVFALGSSLLLRIGEKALALGLIPSAVVCIVGLLMHCELLIVWRVDQRRKDAALTGSLILQGGRTDLFKHLNCGVCTSSRNNL